MKINKQYMVSIKIKVHTQPLREIVYEKIGTFLKETNATYIFDAFRVRKANVIKIHEVVV